jgi:hypothetical protein
MSRFTRRWRASWVIAAAWSSMALTCEPTPEVQGTRGDADADADTDTDADADADADADTDTDTDTTMLTEIDVECDDAYPTPAPQGCVTEVISCGDTIYGNNAGGSTLFEADGQFEQCSGSANGDDTSGPERVYELRPGGSVRSVYVALRSCEPSWLFWYQGGPSCPSTDTIVNCSYPDDPSLVAQDEYVLLGDSGVITFVVEGFQNDGGNYTLQVNCFED